MAVAVAPSSSHAADNTASSPRSPTLSDAGMILPVHEADLSCSSPPRLYNPHRPPSPSSLRDRAALPAATWGGVRSQSLCTQSSRATLRAMAETDGAMKRAPSRDTVLASSPTLHGPLSSHPPDVLDVHDLRTVGMPANSVHSGETDNWPGFDSNPSLDERSPISERGEEKQEHFSSDPAPSEDLNGEPWLNGHHSGGSGSDNDDDDDPQSSAALSRRAEIILANAKKRLNVMEGNLRGARESLVVSPVFNASSDFSHHFTPGRERDRKLYAGMGPIPPRTPHRYSLLLPNTTTSRERGMSDAAVPLPFTSNLTRSASTKRASSAFGHTSGPWAPEGIGQGRFPVKESKSFEVLRDQRNGWNGAAERQSTPRSASRSSKSPTALETLPEDGGSPAIHRSASAASGLRIQMNDLRGRISSLKQRAQEDQLRRQSLQSLRTPSPFNSASSWNSGSSPTMSVHTGLGIHTESPTIPRSFGSEYSRSLTPTTTVSQKEGEELLNDGLAKHMIPTNRSPTPEYIKELSEIGEAEELDSHGPPHTETFLEDETADETEDFVSIAGDTDADSVSDEAANSIYEDAVYEMPATERHEDRVDAFDYENFFLHSAMGTYSLEGGRRGSASSGSGSSTATTRPVTAVQAGGDGEDEEEEEEPMDGEGDQSEENPSTIERPVSYHQRNASADSISTMATFATAAEDLSEADDDNDDANEPMAHFSAQLLSMQSLPHPQRQSQPPPTTSSNTTSPATTTTANSRRLTQPALAQLRADSAIHMRRPPTSSTPSPAASTAHTPLAPSRASSATTTLPTHIPTSIPDALAVSKIFSILTEPPSSSPSASSLGVGLNGGGVEPRLALTEEDKEVLYGLVVVLRGVVGGLQRPFGEVWEREGWRRRLVEARRVLGGEAEEEERREGGDGVGIEEEGMGEVF